MARTGIIVQEVESGDDGVLRIMDDETYEAFGADIGDSVDVNSLSEDDEVTYEENSNGDFSYTITGLA